MEQGIGFKSTHLFKTIDRLGRVNVPEALRREYDICPHSDIEMYVVDNSVILERFIARCCFCNSEDNITTFKLRTICKQCARELTELRQARPN